jgi:hypothetical protein
LIRFFPQYIGPHLGEIYIVNIFHIGWKREGYMRYRTVVVGLLLSLLIIPIVAADREPNDDPQHAEKITEGFFGGEVTSEWQDNLDYFRISVPSGSVLHVKLGLPQDYENPTIWNTMTLYDFEKDPIQTIEIIFSDSNDELHWKNAYQRPKDYYLEVGSTFEWRYSITIRITKDLDDDLENFDNIRYETEPNDSFDEAQSITEGTYEGKIEVFYILDMDVYTMDIPPRSILEVNINYLDIDLYYYIDPGKIWICDDGGEIERYLEGNSVLMNIEHRRSFSNEVDTVEFENRGLSSKKVYILVEGTGEYEMRTRIKMDPVSFIGGLIIVGVIGLLVMIGVSVGLVRVKKSRKKKRSQQQQYVNYVQQYPAYPQASIGVDNNGQWEEHNVEKVECVVIDD